MAYNVNPSPTQGTGAFGLVPGATEMPDNIYQQLQGAYSPFMAQLGSAGQNITDELAGNVDMPSIARKAAAFGIGSGMPGSGFQAATGLNMTIQAQQAMKRQGLQDYMGLSGMLGGMQTPQSTAIGLSENNANLGAAPNPQAVYQKMLDDYMKFRNQNPAGGTGTYNPPPIVSGAAGGSRTGGTSPSGGTGTGSTGTGSSDGRWFYGTGTGGANGTGLFPDNGSIYPTSTVETIYGDPNGATYYDLFDPWAGFNPSGWGTGGVDTSGGNTGDPFDWLDEGASPIDSGSGGSPALGDMGFGDWYDSGGGY